MITRSDWIIEKVVDDKVFIIDRNLGRMSVTNDAENVYKVIQHQYPGKRLIYTDSEGIKDEIYLTKTWIGSTIKFKSYIGD